MFEVLYSLFQVLFQVLHSVFQAIFQAIAPFVGPICLFMAWFLVILVAWSIWGAIAATLVRAKEMHQIPCAYCQFFTNDYRLKCPVRPTFALTEEAIGCPDYRAVPTIEPFDNRVVR